TLGFPESCRQQKRLVQKPALAAVFSVAALAGTFDACVQCLSSMLETDSPNIRLKHPIDAQSPSSTAAQFEYSQASECALKLANDFSAAVWEPPEPLWVAYETIAIPEPPMCYARCR